MLANDTTAERNVGGFSLLVHAHSGVTELMCECRKCASIARYPLELAWRLRTLRCGECLTSVRLHTADLLGLREQLIESRVRVDRLISAGSEVVVDPREPG
jgi:hypothetical protein